MSAFIVNETHLQSIIAYAMQFGAKRVKREAGGPWHIVEPGTLMGKMFLAENVMSVNARYPNDKQDLPYSFRFNAGKAKTLTAIQFIKALQCLEYQSCEHEGWQGSIAQKLIAALIEDAIYKLPGYGEAAWEVKPS